MVGMLTWYILLCTTQASKARLRSVAVSGTHCCHLSRILLNGLVLHSPGSPEHRRNLDSSHLREYIPCMPSTESLY